MKLLLKNLLFTGLVPGTVGVYLPLWIAWPRSATRGVPAMGAWVLVGAGGALYLSSLVSFVRDGEATPAPIDAPRRLVVCGPYRWVRNPMYLGVLTVVLGWTVLFRSWALVLYGVAIGVAFQLFILFFEEPRLRQTFGEEYVRYCRQTPRWPRLRR